MQLQLAAAIKRRQIISDYPDTDGQYTEYSNMLGSGEYPDTDGQYASQPGAHFRLPAPCGELDGVGVGIWIWIESNLV
jgi:hypothetical protein